jgi:hypothetical protein
MSRSARVTFIADEALIVYEAPGTTSHTGDECNKPVFGSSLTPHTDAMDVFARNSELSSIVFGRDNPNALAFTGRLEAKPMLQQYPASA